MRRSMLLLLVHAYVSKFIGFAGLAVLPLGELEGLGFGGERNYSLYRATP